MDAAELAPLPPPPYPEARLSLLARVVVALLCFALVLFSVHLHTPSGVLFCLAHAFVHSWLIFETSYLLRVYVLPRLHLRLDPPWKRSAVIVGALLVLTVVLNLLDRFGLDAAYRSMGWLTADNAGRFYDATLLVRLCTLLAISGYFSAQMSFLRMEQSLRSQAQALLSAADARRERDEAELERERAEADARHARQLAAEAELAALKMQINPHFLFNTLGTIAALARIDGPRAGVMTEKLADMFRYALQSSKHPHTSLGEELDFLCAYFEIEKARFGERLHLDLDIPDKFRAHPVPNLLLQPMVENAVEHAFRERCDNWRVAVTARDEGGNLVITVADNGRGFPAEVDPSDCIGRGTALQNIDQRLRRAYGPDHYLRVSRAEPHGAVFTALIPLCQP